MNNHVFKYFDVTHSEGKWYDWNLVEDCVVYKTNTCVLLFAVLTELPFKVKGNDEKTVLDLLRNDKICPVRRKSWLTGQLLLYPF
jgi:hypothetical protein